MDPWYEYSGKPPGLLRLEPDVYKDLDVSIPPTLFDGIEHRFVYLNVDVDWQLPKSDPMYWFQSGVIRVRWTRAGAKPDPTAFQTFALHPWENTLISHTHWDMGEAGLGGVWCMRVGGMLNFAVVDIRYSKRLHHQ